VLTAKGKINAEVIVSGDGESFLLDSDAEMREGLAARLERYAIADDVQITDVTEEFALLHVSGGNVPEVAGARVVEAVRFGSRGFDFWIEAGRREAVWRDLSVLLPSCDETCAEVLRIERGIPRWGYELTEEIIPNEANMESSTIDYAKGCYIGQEVISRIKMSGQTNKRLCGLVTAGEGELVRGMRLVAQEEQKEVGWVTSVVRSERLGREIALGFLKRGFQERGTALLAREPEGAGSEVSVHVTALPFD
jgi:folate-binding protein YgfZ